jgi:hypothetical protein
MSGTPVMSAIGRGIVAGAVGKVALDSVTYLDMLVRGRPPSDLPERAAEQLAGRVGIDLAGTGHRGHRRTGLAALMGCATGIGFGALYGALRHEPRRGWVGPGVVTGLAAMAGTAVPSTTSGLTDPRRWGITGWLEDLVPHLAYGFATAGVYGALTPR